MAAPKKVDYERLEPAWRAGLQSPAQMAAAYEKDTGVSVSGHAIAKHFKKQGIARDLGAKIRQKADSMVLDAMVAGKVTATTKNRDKEIIDEGASQVAVVLLNQRTDIQRSRSLVMSLLGELEFATGNRELMDQLGELLRSEDDKGQDKRNDLYQKVISLSGRVSNVKQLSDSLKTLVGLEREAFGIDERSGEASPQDAFAQLLGAISQRGSRLPTGTAE